MEALPQSDSQTKAQKLFATSEEVAYGVEELHDRLVEFDAPLTYDPSLERPTVEIVNDDEIVVDGHRLLLTRLDRFVFNSLRISQGYPQTARDIYDAGFEGHIQSIQPSITKLSSFLCRVAAVEAITQESSSVRTPRSYTLIPEVEVIDARSSERTTKQFLLERFAAPLEDGSVADENGVVSFVSRGGRIKVTQQLVRDFRHLAGDIDQESVKVSRSISIRSPEMAPLTKEEEAELLAIKEAALKVYVETDDTYSEAETQTILNGVHAYDNLLMSQTRSLRRIAGKYAADRTPFAELYQFGFEKLMAVVAAAKPQQDGTSLSFRVVAHLSQSLAYHSAEEAVSLVSFPKDVLSDIKKIRGFLAMSAEQGSGRPDIKTIAEHTSLPENRVISVLNLRKKSLNDDTPNFYNGMLATSELEAPEYLFALEEERQSRLDAIDTVFDSSALKDAEKVVISLFFGIFRPTLSGFELRYATAEGVYVYPYTAEEFDAQITKKFDLGIIEKQILYQKQSYARKHLSNGLRVARKVLVDDPLFDHSEFERSEGFVQNQEERALIVEQALQLQPDTPISPAQVAALARDGLFFSPRTIQRVFGTMAEFHKACGFEPDMSTLLRSMSNADIAALALKLQPDTPLRRGAIEKLSANNAFPDRGTLIRRFGSMSAFHEACGFEQQPEVSDMSNEELITLARKLQPDEPLNSSQIKALCKQGKYIGVTSIVRRFGSMSAFHEACGFEQNSAVRFRTMSNEELVVLALELKPKIGFTPQQLADLNKQGMLPQPSTIRSRFGSVAEFNKACGLEDPPLQPRMAVRSMSAEDVVAMALRLSPDEPFITSQIMALAKEGKLVSIEAVLKRFGSVAEFNKACGLI